MGVVGLVVLLDLMSCSCLSQGFVSYDNPTSAQAAIQSMNGFQVSG